MLCGKILFNCNQFIWSRMTPSYNSLLHGYHARHPFDKGNVVSTLLASYILFIQKSKFQLSTDYKWNQNNHWWKFNGTHSYKKMYSQNFLNNRGGSHYSWLLKIRYRIAPNFVAKTFVISWIGCSKINISWKNFCEVNISLFLPRVTKYSWKKFSWFLSESQKSQKFSTLKV